MLYIETLVVVVSPSIAVCHVAIDVYYTVPRIDVIILVLCVSFTAPASNNIIGTVIGVVVGVVLLVALIILGALVLLLLLRAKRTGVLLFNNHYE